MKKADILSAFLVCSFYKFVVRYCFKIILQGRETVRLVNIFSFFLLVISLFSIRNVNAEETNIPLLTHGSFELGHLDSELHRTVYPDAQWGYEIVDSTDGEPILNGSLFYYGWIRHVHQATTEQDRRLRQISLKGKINVDGPVSIIVRVLYEGGNTWFDRTEVLTTISDTSSLNSLDINLTPHDKPENIDRNIASVQVFFRAFGPAVSFVVEGLQLNLMSETSSGGNFVPSGPKFLGDAHRWDTQNGNTHDVAFGDIDGDGDLDFFTANSGSYQETKVYVNDGLGNYTDSNQALSLSHGKGVALGDIDNDGDLDAVVVQGGARKPNKVFINDGVGRFRDSGQELGNNSSSEVVLGDLDGDGDLDMAVANDSAHHNNIYLNDGEGNFSLFYQTPTTNSSTSIDLGDIDGDGDLDMVVANVGRQIVFNGPYYYKQNKIFFNNGDGSFTDSNQNLGAQRSQSIKLGDIDNDGDFDIVVANGLYATQDAEASDRVNRIYLNDGSGRFPEVGIGFGSYRSAGITLGDIDSDGDIDVVESNFQRPGDFNVVYFNDGEGNLIDSKQPVDPHGNSFCTALGDIDGDGDLDMVIGNSGYNTILINE